MGSCCRRSDQHRRYFQRLARRSLFRTGVKLKRLLVYVAVLVLGLVAWYKRDQHGTAATAANALMVRHGLSPWAACLLFLGLIFFVAGSIVSSRRRKQAVNQASHTLGKSGDDSGTWSM